MKLTWRPTRFVCGNALPLLILQKEEVPEEPKEITDFFKNFAKTSEADKDCPMESLQERATRILIEHEARHLPEG